MRPRRLCMGGGVIGVACSLGLCVEGGVEVLRMDPRRGIFGGGASVCSCCVVIVKGSA